MREGTIAEKDRYGNLRMLQHDVRPTELPVRHVHSANLERARLTGAMRGAGPTPPLADQSVVDLQPDRGEVLAEVAIGDCAGVAASPRASRSSRSNAYTALRVSAVMLAVADEVADDGRCRDRSCFGPGAPDLDRTVGRGCLPMPVSSAFLYGLGWRRPMFTESITATGSGYVIGLVPALVIPIASPREDARSATGGRARTKPCGYGSPGRGSRTRWVVPSKPAWARAVRTYVVSCRNASSSASCPYGRRLSPPAVLSWYREQERAAGHQHPMKLREDGPERMEAACE